MKIIKRIINWLINWLKKIFGKKKVTKKIKKNMSLARNKHYFKGYGVRDDELGNLALPIYLLISQDEKKDLLQKIDEIKNELLEINVEEEALIIDVLEKTKKKIKDGKISFYQNELLKDKMETFRQDKEVQINLEEKLVLFQDNVKEIVDNFDKNIKEKVLKEYQEINFVTLTTVLLDDAISAINKLEDDYKHHKYNKYYYERELNKIKERIKKLKSLRDSVKVREEIELLRKNIYTKSKDKYDLLYSDEIFLNIRKNCDDLIVKVNRKIVDLKSIKKDDKQVEKQEEKKDKTKEDKEYLERIIKRFQDLDLARKLLLLNSKQKGLQLQSAKELFSYLDNSYYEFVNGEKLIFNYERNKTKTELVKLYNDLNMLECMLNKKEFIFVSHINDAMDSLLEKVIMKKNIVEESIEEQYHYEPDKNEKSILVDNKLEILKLKEEERKEIYNGQLVKKKVNKE